MPRITERWLVYPEGHSHEVGPSFLFEFREDGKYREAVAYRGDDGHITTPNFPEGIEWGAWSVPWWGNGRVLGYDIEKFEVPHE